MRTQQEIDTEIAALQAVRNHVMPASMFGDDNQAAITAQIDVLESNFDAQGVAVVYGDTTAPDYDEYVHSAATEAYLWLSGQSDEAPSEGWV